MAADDKRKFLKIELTDDEVAALEARAREISTSNGGVTVHWRQCADAIMHSALADLRARTRESA